MNSKFLTFRPLFLPIYSGSVRTKGHTPGSYFGWLMVKKYSRAVGSEQSDYIFLLRRLQMKTRLSAINKTLVPGKTYPNLVKRNRSIPKIESLDSVNRIGRFRIWNRPMQEHYRPTARVLQSDCTNVTVGRKSLNNRGD